MNKFWITLSVLCFSTMMFAQKEVLYTEIDLQPDGRFYQKNNNVPFSGTIIDIYSDGIKKLKMSVKNGVPNGKYAEFYPNGDNKVNYNLVDGVKSGKETQYYENGQLQTELTYSDGFPNGVVKEYYKDGQLMSEGTFEKGKEKGKHTWYFSNGKTEQTIEYLDGLANGESLLYYYTGELKSKTILQSGQKNGTYLEYAKNGQLIKSGQFVNGVADGIHSEWLSSGQLIEKVTFSSGQVINTEVFRSAELTLSKGYRQVFNNLGAYFTVDLVGDKVEPFRYDGDIYLVDGILIEIKSIPTSIDDKKDLSTFVSNQKKKIEDAINLPENPDFSYIFRKPNPYLNDTLNVSLDIQQSVANYNGVEFIEWSYTEPSINSNPERQRMLVTSQHFISRFCNDYTLTISSFLTDKIKDEAKMKAALIKVLESVKVYTDPIELTKMAQSIVEKNE